MFRAGMLLLALLTTSVSALDDRAYKMNQTEKRQMVLEYAFQRAKRFEGQVKVGNTHVLYDDAHGKRILRGDTIVGVPTIGYGVNLLVGLDEVEAEFITKHRIELAYNDCVANFPWFGQLSYNRQAAMVDLRYNMGLATLLTFDETLALGAAGKFEEMAKQLALSKYHRQTGPRAVENENLLSKG